MNRRPQRIQLHPGPKPEDAVMVARPSIWANPYRPVRWGTQWVTVLLRYANPVRP
jgi:hypothetical protein